MAQAPDPTSLAEGRARLEAGRRSLRDRHRAGLSGFDTVREMSDLIDSLVVDQLGALCVASPGNDVAPLALVATGGYGRRELAPRSDVDVLAVLPTDARRSRAEAIAERLHRVLWDLGLEAGFAARTLDQTVSLAREDHTIRTALLDARLLGGDGELWNGLVRVLRTRIEPVGVEEFIAEKVRELEDRRQRFGSSIWLLEPHLKQGKGGLRDLQAALWIARARRAGISSLDEVESAGLLPARDARAARAACELLFRLRAELHFATGRRDDRVTFDHQRRLAEAFGHRDGPGGELAVERLMRELYAAFDDVARACDALVDRCAVEDVPGRRAPPARPIDQAFQLREGRVAVVHRRVFDERPAELVRLFAVAEREGCRLHSSTRELVLRELHRLRRRLAGDPEAHRELWGLLAREGANGGALLALHETEVLGALLPELQRLRARVQHSLHHVYTVDTHTVFALVRAQRLRAGLLDDDEPGLTRIGRALPRPLVLMLGLLFHDLGKGLGGDHSAAGAQLLRDYSSRTGLDPLDAADVEWLVREHLRMSHIAQRRDLDDPQLLASFAAEVRTQERLDLLYLLTWADMASVSPESWTPWKAHLLRTLHGRTSAALGAGKPDADAETRRRRLLDATGAAGFLEQAPVRYLRAADPSAVTRHARLWAAVGREGLVAELWRGPGGESRLDVAARDRPGLLALLAAALSAHGIEVLSAEAFVFADGTALDAFVVREAGGGPLEEERWRRACADLRRLLDGELEARALVRRRVAGPGWSRTPSPRVPTRVRLDVESSEDCTVVDVVAEDRPALLFDLAEALHAVDVGIEVARIATEGNRATDAFYVRDLATARPDGGLGKIVEPGRLAAIAQAIEQAIARGAAGG